MALEKELAAARGSNRSYGEREKGGKKLTTSENSFLRRHDMRTETGFTYEVLRDE